MNVKAIEIILFLLFSLTIKNIPIKIKAAPKTNKDASDDAQNRYTNWFKQSSCCCLEGFEV